MLLGDYEEGVKVGLAISPILMFPCDLRVSFCILILIFVNMDLCIESSPSMKLVILELKN